MEAIQSIASKQVSTQMPRRTNIPSGQSESAETKREKIALDIDMEDDNRYAMDDLKEADWLKEFRSKQSD